MSTIILYLGGMAGDFFVSCLSPNQFESINVAVTLKPEFGKLKKFWQMDTEAKTEYINSFSNNAFLSSHDTEFSQLYPNRTIRIKCSNQGTLLRLSQRFGALHKPEVLEHLCNQHTIDPTNFDQEYADMCTNWNNSFNFPIEFDISNIYTNQFISDFETFCQTNSISYDKSCVTELHQTWLKQNENFKR